jgi:serine protease AprX
LVGTAPDATYYLFSTEDNANEGLPEEYNWAMAAEMADSLMSENAIITTSLGYSNGFDIPNTNHTYQDMDGNTTPITIAADLAASKGFLVINSAGNSGNDPWRYITAPSDGDSVLCVGAVDSSGLVVGFSSRGPSADGEVKPNVCAQGSAVAGVNVFENIVKINGTSFSCPIIAGMAACLWQAFPDKSNMEIFYAIEKSAHLYAKPNNDYGYGIPNFYLANLYLLDEKLAELYLINQNVGENELVIIPNPVSESFHFILKNEDLESAYNVKIYNFKGELMKSQDFIKNEDLNVYFFEDITSLSSGSYFLSIKTRNGRFQSKFIKR